MGPNFGGFFEEDDAEVFVAGFVGELLEADCGGETCWACDLSN